MGHYGIKFPDPESPAIASRNVNEINCIKVIFEVMKVKFGVIDLFCVRGDNFYKSIRALWLAFVNQIWKWGFDVELGIILKVEGLLHLVDVLFFEVCVRHLKEITDKFYYEIKEYLINL